MKATWSDWLVVIFMWFFGLVAFGIVLKAMYRIFLMGWNLL